MFTFKHKKESGQGLVEYALILVLVAVVVIAAATLLGPQIGGVFSDVNTSLSFGDGGGNAPAPTPTTRSRSAGCAAINGFGSSYWGDIWAGTEMEYYAGEVVTFTVGNPGNVEVTLRSVPHMAFVGSTTASNYTVSYTIPTTQNYRWWADIYIQSTFSLNISCE
jgi:pilus assembly protein Flp/PilA